MNAVVGVLFCSRSSPTAMMIGALVSTSVVKEPSFRSELYDEPFFVDTFFYSICYSNGWTANSAV